MTIIVKYFRILNLENNCHTASPDTTGKLTENKTISCRNYISSTEVNSPPGQLFLQVANIRLEPLTGDEGGSHS